MTSGCQAVTRAEIEGILKVWTPVAAGFIVQMWRLPDWQEGKCCQSAVAAARHEEEADGTR